MKSLRNLLAMAAFGIFATSSWAQELNCEVSVMAPQINNVERSVFESLESDIRDFMNTRKWTNDFFEFDERIDCFLQLTISEAVTQTQFRAQMQIQASRPIYNSDYRTSTFSANDQDVEFNYAPNIMINFSLDQYRDNLSSILAYYAYMILASDYDSFSLEGGTEYFQKSQQIVANAQNSGMKGWKSGDGPKSRYALVDNIMSQSFKPLRKCMYRYHRHGFDKLYDDPEAARKEIADQLIALRSIHKIKPASYNMQLFFLAKSDEVVDLFSPAPKEERLRIYSILVEIDPGNITKYDKMMG
jgi:hypothetical protein